MMSWSAASSRKQLVCCPAFGIHPALQQKQALIRPVDYQFHEFTCGHFEHILFLCRQNIPVMHEQLFFDLGVVHGQTVQDPVVICAHAHKFQMPIFTVFILQRQLPGLLGLVCGSMSTQMPFQRT
jgi:hypothetical protein